jgi:hypothetical protein
MEEIEKQLIELIAIDRIDIPISSMSGKLKRRKDKRVQAIELDAYGGEFEGERVYARTEVENERKARGMKEGIDLFCEMHPRYGRILTGMIEEQRALKQTHMYFGTKDGRRLTADDYLGVMADLGFTDATARSLYPQLADISRRLTRKRDEERSILIG